MGVKKEDGIVPMAERLVAADISRYKLVRNNWFAYNPMRLNIGSIARWQGESDVLVSPDYVVFRCLERSMPTTLLPEYFDSFRGSRQWDAFVSEAGDGGVRVRIYYRDIAQLQLALPDVEEQKKIANCLGSLDDLIVAEGRKLESLRQHKQGLMQQLFPQAGETQPRLRFPEFRSAGDWHFQPLSDIAEPISERVGTSKCVPMSVTTGVGLLSQEEKFGRTIAGNSYKNYIRLQTNDFAYNKSATKEFPQGYIARYSGTRDVAVPNSIFACFRPDIAAVIPEYLDHLFHRNHHGRWLRKYITVGARTHGALSVSDDALMSMPVPLPPVAVSRPEQKKIADCLGPLDNLIAAEGRKLEVLRQHKQGLMQQLFPSLEGH